MYARLSPFFPLIVAATFAASGAASAANLPTRTTAAAAVTVTATPRPLTGATWEFELSFNTHSSELTDDLVKSASLVVDGRKAYSPLAWQGDPPGGHHRSGVLQFKRITPQPKSIELRITRGGEPKPRVFQWTLK